MKNRYARGNASSEIDQIKKRFATEIECNNTGVRRLAKTFSDIGDYPKPIPKKGRPPLSEWDIFERVQIKLFWKAARKIDRIKRTGQLSLFDNFR